MENDIGRLVLTRRPGEAIWIGQPAAPDSFRLAVIEIEIGMHAVLQDSRMYPAVFYLYPFEGFELTDNIRITLIAADYKTQIKLAIEAPRSINISREELWNR